MTSILDRIDAVDRALVGRSDLTAQEIDYLRGLVRHLAVETAGLIKPNDLPEMIDAAGVQAREQGAADAGCLPVGKAVKRPKE